MDMGWKFEDQGKEEWYTCDDVYDTKEEAIEAGREWFKEEDPDVEWFDVGRAVKPEIPKIHAYHVIDMLTEAMYENCGEVSDSWLSSVSAQEQSDLTNMLHKTLVEWLEKTSNMPNFFTVVDIETVPMQEEAKL